MNEEIFEVNLLIIKSLKKKLAKIYKIVHPNVKPTTEIKVPKVFPNTNPDTIARGEAKPSKRVQIIRNNKYKNVKSIKYSSFKIIKNLDFSLM